MIFPNQDSTFFPTIPLNINSKLGVKVIFEEGSKPEDGQFNKYDSRCDCILNKRQIEQETTTDQSPQRLESIERLQINIKNTQIKIKSTPLELGQWKVQEGHQFNLEFIIQR